MTCSMEVDCLGEEAMAYRNRVPEFARPPLNPRQAARMCADFKLTSADDLPTAEAGVFMIEDKARVIAAVIHGLIDEEQASRRYSISPREFRVWLRLVECSSFVPA